MNDKHESGRSSVQGAGESPAQFGYCMRCGNVRERRIPEGDTVSRLVCTRCAFAH